MRVLRPVGAGRASPPVAAFVLFVEEDPDSRAVRVDARMCMAGGSRPRAEIRPGPWRTENRQILKIRKSRCRRRGLNSEPFAELPSKIAYYTTEPKD